MEFLEIATDGHVFIFTWLKTHLISVIFLLFSDYMNSRCQSYDVDTNTRTGRQKLEKDSIVNYFEKICLRGGT